MGQGSHRVALQLLTDPVVNSVCHASNLSVFIKSHILVVNPVPVLRKCIDDNLGHSTISLVQDSCAPVVDDLHRSLRIFLSSNRSENTVEHRHITPFVVLSPCVGRSDGNLHTAISIGFIRHDVLRGWRSIRLHLPDTKTRVRLCRHGCSRNDQGGKSQQANLQIPSAHRWHSYLRVWADTGSMWIWRTPCKVSALWTLSISRGEFTSIRPSTFASEGI